MANYSKMLLLFQFFKILIGALAFQPPCRGYGMVAKFSSVGNDSEFGSSRRMGPECCLPGLAGFLSRTLIQGL